MKRETRDVMLFSPRLAFHQPFVVRQFIAVPTAPVSPRLNVIACRGHKTYPLIYANLHELGFD